MDEGSFSLPLTRMSLYPLLSHNYQPSKEATSEGLGEVDDQGMAYPTVSVDSWRGRSKGETGAVE